MKGVKEDVQKDTECCANVSEHFLYRLKEDGKWIFIQKTKAGDQSTERAAKKIKQSIKRTGESQSRLVILCHSEKSKERA